MIVWWDPGKIMAEYRASSQSATDLFPVICIDAQGIKVKIPNWIEDLLFKELGAKHQPSGRNRDFDNNLDADEASIQTYLGTYFPRSLAESFTIFDSLLSEESYASHLSGEGTIDICSVGTGTGGDLLGLILALEKRLPRKAVIRIISIEGNAGAHERACRIIASAQGRLGSTIEPSFTNYVFRGPKPFENISSLMPSKSVAFDFVISSKMLNELDGAKVSERPYEEFCEAFTAMLKPCGALMVLDVTSPNSANGQWTPEVLNGQVNGFLKKNQGFKTILPLLCNSFEEQCERQCYTQNRIYVTYRNISNECSKICYRVIGPRDFVKSIDRSGALWECPITKNNMEHCEEFAGRQRSEA